MEKSWLPNSLVSDPRVLALNSSSFRVYFQLFSYTGLHELDGFVPAHVARPRKAVEELVAAGLLRPAEGGFWLDDWVGAGNKTRAQMETYRAAGRAGAQARWDANRNANRNANRYGEERRGEGEGNLRVESASRDVNLGSEGTRYESLIRGEASRNEPRLGGDAYPDLVEAALAAGHLTSREADEQRIVHELVCRSREARAR